MLNKYYEKLKKFIINNYIVLTFYLIFIATLTYQLPYYIYTGGGTINTEDRIEIKEGYNTEGSFNLSYVSQINATIPTLILSNIFKDWEIESIDDYLIDDSDTKENIELRDKLYLEEANNNAIYNAYNLANEKIEIENIKNTVIYIKDNNTTDIKIGDIIIKIDEKEIKNLQDIKNIVNSKSNGEYINIEVLRNNKIINCKAKIFTENNNKMIGISIITTYEYKLEKEIELKFKNNESGPSGGLMTALTIYNKLTSEDITNGLNIAGTGTIDIDGNIGEIGGIKYKLLGAVKNKMDVFIAPTGDNYNEVKKLKEEKGLDIIIIEAKTLEQVINELNNLKIK